MVPTIRIHSLAAALLAVAVPALPAAARQAATNNSHSSENNGVMCEAWGGASTTDPGVEIEALKDTDQKPRIMFNVDAENRYKVALISDMDEVFPSGVYTSHNGPTQHRTTNLDGAFIHRTITTDLIDIMAVSGLETDTPQLIWQRFRLDEGVPLETQLIADCRR